MIRKGTQSLFYLAKTFGTLIEMDFGEPSNLTNCLYLFLPVLTNFLIDVTAAGLSYSE